MSTWTDITAQVSKANMFEGYVLTDGHLCVITNPDGDNSYCDSNGLILGSLPAPVDRVPITAYNDYNYADLFIDEYGELSFREAEYANPTSPIPSFTVIYPVAGGQ